MKVYLAGPMVGIPDYNFPMFFSAAEELEARGYEVFNPAQNDLDTWGTIEEVKRLANYRDCLQMDLSWICSRAEAIALLPGWENSKGCAVEFELAKVLGLKFIYL